MLSSSGVSGVVEMGVVEVDDIDPQSIQRGIHTSIDGRRRAKRLKSGCWLTLVATTTSSRFPRASSHRPMIVRLPAVVPGCPK